MKKIITLFSLLLVASFSIAQPDVQRLVLVEEFTNASCGPCAAYNPAFNAILQSPDMANKIISIKYQTNWPGADPMNAQTQAEVAPRVTYYSVGGVPNAVLDGNAWQGNPSAFTAAMVNTEYAVPSPFTISVNHLISGDYDSVYVTVIVTAASPVTGNLVLHTAMLEDLIDFQTAPGSNGEKEFFNVMRKMLPGSAGTTLANNWAVGDADTVSFAVAMPTYIYNLDQISVIAWVQDNANKNIKQAGVSPRNTQGFELGVESVAGFPEMTCSLPINGFAVIKNNGTMDVTSCTIKWQLDNGTVDSLNWVGTLAVGDTFQIPFNGMNPSYGEHKFKVWVASINGGAKDIHPTNNEKESSFVVINQSFPYPTYSGFQDPTFPPTNWVIVNPGADSYKWERYANAGGFGQSTASSRIQFFNIAPGVIDELYLAPTDLSTATAAVLTFNMAHARYDATYKDRLKIEISTDCGATWTTTFNKVDPALATYAAYVTSAYVPAAGHWRAESVDLTPFIGATQVLVKFVGVSGYSNNLYIDDVNLTTAVGIDENSITSSFEVFPNPLTDVANIAINLANPADVSLEVSNAVGQMVYERSMGVMAPGKYNTTFDSNILAPGFYYVKLSVNGEKIVKKISVIR